MRNDLLTWEGIRALATCEALTPHPTRVILATPDPARPVLKWKAQRHWFNRATPMVPGCGAILFARTAWRAPYRDLLLGQVRAPSVLVSAFCDSMIRSHATERLLADASPIRRWFGVQVMTTHPRLTAMPVGIEGSMVPVLQAAEQRSERDILLYLNFARPHPFMGVAYLRDALWQTFAQWPWVTAVEQADAATYAAHLGRAKFVLSPPGHGWDCYRTYEAMAMGAIPIVKRQPPMSNHLEALPVLLVDHWSDVTPERLQHEWESRQPRSVETMTMSYWRQQILAAAKEC